jgi:hypothetical protein
MTIPTLPVQECTNLLVNDPVLAKAMDQYARAQLKADNVEVPDELDDFEPYWALTSQFYRKLLHATIAQFA